MASTFGKRGAATNTPTKPQKADSEDDNERPPKASFSSAIGIIALGASMVGGVALWAAFTTNRTEITAADIKTTGHDPQESSNSLALTKTVFAQNTDQSPDYPTVIIISYCHEKWRSDDGMRDYCENEQRGAKDTAQKENFTREVRVLCAARWPEDWPMYLKCGRDEMVAQTHVHELPTEPSDKIEEHCYHEWPDKPTMEADCKQREFVARADVSHFQVQDDVAKRCAAEWPENWRMYKDCVMRDGSTR